ncbi:MAG TPA: serine/threonine protein kinase, partial [Aquificaceae bacterium]|nr:serine/threonine protein kinase [Aquificaceae bacterium]
MDRELREGELILGYYRVLGTIGKGDFGVVYKVRGEKGRYRGKILALKVATNPYAVEHLWKEAQTLILFNHPNIISLQSYLYKKESRELYVLYEL